MMECTLLSNECTANGQCKRASKLASRAHVQCLPYPHALPCPEWFCLGPSCNGVPIRPLDRP